MFHKGFFFKLNFPFHRVWNRCRASTTSRLHLPSPGNDASRLVLGPVGCRDKPTQKTTSQSKINRGTQLHSDDVSGPNFQINAIFIKNQTRNGITKLCKHMVVLDNFITF